MLRRDDFQEASVFLPENLMREARRQNDLSLGQIPAVCLLDPDGDIVRYLESFGSGAKSTHWACYHTEMHVVELPSGPVGIVGCAVGASFAVLVAEQMFASGCQFLVSLTSAGRISQQIQTSTIVVIERALRGEGTSFAYIPPAPDVMADPELVELACFALRDCPYPTLRGTTWTTDAPYRETDSILALAANQGAIAVEMEASALYAFGQACERPVLCLAHVTNDMAVDQGDFEKGEFNGASAALTIVDALASEWLTTKGSNLHGH
jgi:uridine phosphorylase